MKITNRRVAAVWGLGLLCTLGILIVGVKLFVGTPLAQNAEAQDADPVTAQSREDEGAIDYALAIDPEMDMSEARRRARLLEEVRPTLNAIRGEVSDSLMAGFSIEHEPDLHLRLRLTGEPSPTLRSIIDESPVPVTVSTDAPASLSESQRRLDGALPALKEAVPELETVWVDERTGDVVMHVFIEGDPEQVEEAKSRIEKAADSLAQEIDLPVRIRYLPAPLTFGHTYGGTNLAVSGFPSCTGGFTVKENGSGVAGLLTAAHCNNSQTYVGFGSDGTYPLTFESGEVDSDSDVQWHTDTHFKAPEFYADSTTFRRPVEAVVPWSSVMEETRSVIAGRQLATPAERWRANFPSVPVAAARKRVTTSGFRWKGGQLRGANEGTAGGPVNWQRSAYGIYSGQSTNGPGDGDCVAFWFTSSTYVSDLGVEIWVQQ